jgi:membrane protein DedA with SNARE-associated domain/rhodanese-related sulfurtransferase
MQDLVALLVEHGTLAVFVATLAARVGAPVPASPLMVVAGALVAGGQLPAALTVLCSLAANVAGDCVWYEAGRRHGRRVMRLLCRISLSPDSCVRQSEALIARWGGSSLVAAKFVPGVSVVAAPMAGALGMAAGRFLAFALLAAAVWTAVFLALGIAFSRQIRRVLELMANAGMAALALLVLAAAAALAWRWWRRRRLRRELDMPRVTVDELRRLLLEAPGPLVVDVRSGTSAQVDPRRIAGAVAVELSAIEAESARWPREREVVLYCNCPDEASAARAATVLRGLGFRRARPLAGGLDAWESAGGPLSAAAPAGFDLSSPDTAM